MIPPSHTPKPYCRAATNGNQVASGQGGKPLPNLINNIMPPKQSLQGEGAKTFKLFSYHFIFNFL